MATILRRPPGLVKPPLGAQINTAHPLAKGLVGAWLMNEGGGSKVYDISGNNNNGTMTSVSWVNGRFGAAQSFNGTTSKVILSPTPLPRGASPRTISSWFFDKGTGNNNQSFLSYGTDANGQRVSISINDAYFAVACNGSNYGNSSLSLANIWHHVAVVFPNGATANNQWLFYVDGQPISASLLAGSAVTINTGNTYAAYGTDTLGDFQTGYIDNLLFYNRALSASEIQQLYVQPFSMMQGQYRYFMADAAAPSSKTYSFAGAGGIQGTGQIGIAS